MKNKPVDFLNKLLFEIQHETGSQRMNIQSIAANIQSLEDDPGGQQAKEAAGRISDQMDILTDKLKSNHYQAIFEAAQQAGRGQTPQELQPHGLFSSRETIQEAINYIESFKDIYTTTAAMVLFNTIAENFYLVAKDEAPEAGQDPKDTDK